MKKGEAALYSAAKKDLAIILRDKILQLGPTFIKLGQLLSTRIDVLPREYIDALILLQDQVPGFPGDTAVRIIEEQLGKPIDQLYDTFDRKAIAAASLGQVHLATLNGQKLAVKVQRQGLKKLFDMDLKNIKVLAILLDKFDPKSDGAQRDWVSIYDESAKLLYKEIDYKAEALNALRFRDNFANIPWVKVPDVSHESLLLASFACQNELIVHALTVLFLNYCLLLGSFRTRRQFLPNVMQFNDLILHFMKTLHFTSSLYFFTLLHDYPGHTSDDDFQCGHHGIRPRHKDKRHPAHRTSRN